MGTARSALFTAASIIMMIFGGLGIAAGGLFFLERSTHTDSSLILVLMISVLMVLYSILNLIAGITGIRSYNRRTNSEVIIRLPEISMGLCLLAFILSFFNGVTLGQILGILLTGLAVPGLFIFAAIRKSQI